MPVGMILLVHSPARRKCEGCWPLPPSRKPTAAGARSWCFREPAAGPGARDEVAEGHPGREREPDGESEGHRHEPVRDSLDGQLVEAAVGGEAGQQRGDPGEDDDERRDPAASAKQPGSDTHDDRGHAGGGHRAQLDELRERAVGGPAGRPRRPGGQQRAQPGVSGERERRGAHGRANTAIPYQPGPCGRAPATWSVSPIPDPIFRASTTPVSSPAESSAISAARPAAVT